MQNLSPPWKAVRLIRPTDSALFPDIAVISLGTRTSLVQEELSRLTTRRSRSTRLGNRKSLHEVVLDIVLSLYSTANGE